MIYELLRKGAENLTPGGVICTTLHITRQELSALVRKERREGKPICSKSGGGEYGYYIAANKAEMLAFCNSLKHRSSEIMKTRRYCLKSAKTLPDERAKGSGPGT